MTKLIMVLTALSVLFIGAATAMAQEGGCCGGDKPCCPNGPCCPTPKK